MVSLVPRRRNSSLQKRATNRGSRSETIVSGSPWALNTCSKKSVAEPAASMFSEHGARCTILLKRHTNTNTPVLPRPSFGNPKTKSKLMDCQHSVGTGRLASGAAAEGATLTRWHVSHVRT
jgi:hypothetical protein